MENPSYWSARIVSAPETIGRSGMAGDFERGDQRLARRRHGELFEIQFRRFPEVLERFGNVLSGRYSRERKR